MDVSRLVCNGAMVEGNENNLGLQIILIYKKTNEIKRFNYN